MNLTDVYQKLRRRDKAPRAFEGEATAIPWADPQFSRAFYELHTRDHKETEVEVEALIQYLALTGNERLLDLGCGGGRTLLALAERGYTGAGIDIGPYPVEVAREALEGFDMQVLQGDMRETSPQGPFDVALCLFGQLTTFPRDEAARILQVAARTLAPQGQLFVELYLGPALLEAIDGMESWTVTDRWMGGTYPQLILDEHYVNWDALEYVRTSHVIAMGEGGPPLATYRQGSIIYDEASLAELLSEAGFYLTGLYGDYEGEPYDDESVNMIAVARLHA